MRDLILAGCHMTAQRGKKHLDARGHSQGHRKGHRQRHSHGHSHGHRQGHSHGHRKRDTWKGHMGPYVNDHADSRQRG